MEVAISLRRSKIIFVFQVTFSKKIGSVGREKKFFCEKSLCYRSQGKSMCNPKMKYTKKMSHLQANIDGG